MDKVPDSAASRRTFLAGAIKCAGIWAVFSAGLARNAFAANVSDKIARWALRLQGECADFRNGAITIAQWREALNRLTADVALEDLLTAIDFNRLKSTTPFAEKGVSTSHVTLPGLTDKRLAFTSKMFAIGPSRAIIPHGHENMVSAHLILGGEMRLRQYDKLAREGEALFITPSVDRIVGAGEISSISLSDDNIHWMTTKTGAWTLDIIMTNVNEGAEEPYDIYNLDMEAAESRENNVLRAPIIGVEEALRKYG